MVRLPKFVKLRKPHLNIKIMKKTNQEWFTVEKIDHETYVISEYGHWEQTHIYLFLGQKRAILLDTGTGIGNIRQEIDKLTNLPILVITSHCHWDHIGGHEHFEAIGIHADDREWLENGNPLPLKVVKANLLREPFSIEPPPKFSSDKYRVYKGKPTYILEDGEELDLGGRKLQIIHTPGHSPGHICVYEEKTGYLATGDILYEGTIYVDYPSTDPEAIQSSVQKLMNLPKIEKLLPGHNNLNISVDILRKFHVLCEEVAAQGEMKHGSGLHETEGISLLL